MRFTGGLPETACGYGSTLAATETLREALPLLLARLGIDVLLDAPCGDCNWIGKVDLGSCHYIGIDNSAKHLATARENFWGADLRTVDIVSGELPKADAVLCRDFLQHLPVGRALAVLRNFLTTGARWFLLTSHDYDENGDTTLGGFSPYNLTLPPFGFPPPLESIEDPPGSVRTIGVWPHAALT